MHSLIRYYSVTSIVHLQVVKQSYIDEQPPESRPSMYLYQAFKFDAVIPLFPLSSLIQISGIRISTKQT